MSWTIASWLVVSIRAPARGATSAWVRSGSSFQFQSAPPHGERLDDLNASVRYKVFQSAPPHGERPCQFPRHCPQADVSIRAPARGATGLFDQDSPRWRVSIRAPARGATKVFHGSVPHNRFQSAPPHGERHALAPQSWYSGVSIRAPARGATQIRTRTRRPANVSIRAPARGATSGQLVVAPSPSFQSAPPHGERRALHAGRAAGR